MRTARQRPGWRRAHPAADHRDPGDLGGGDAGARLLLRARDRSLSTIDVRTDWAWVPVVVHVQVAATAMIHGALLIVQAPTIARRYDADVQAAASGTIPYGQWLGWILDLAIAAWVVRRGRRGLTGLPEPLVDQ